jgi:hypothetical protein
VSGRRLGFVEGTDEGEFRIWAECSGANEAREPGLYQELLHVHKGEENACLNQIDMDCESHSSLSVVSYSRSRRRSSHVPYQYVLCRQRTGSCETTQHSHRVLLVRPSQALHQRVLIRCDDRRNPKIGCESQSSSLRAGTDLNPSQIVKG